MIRSTNALHGLVLLVLAGLPVVAAATPLPPNAETTEALMHAIQADLQGIGRVFGVDETAALEFSTFTDADALTFNYSLTEGTVYEGQLLAMSGQGVYNAAASRWEGQSVFSAGDGAPWVADWTALVESPDPYTTQFDWAAAGGRRWGPDLHTAGGIWRHPDGALRSSGEGHLTWSGRCVGRASVKDKWKVELNLQRWSIIGSYLPDPGEGETFASVLTGFSPEAGGAGMASGGVLLIPEPGSLALLALGCLGAVRRR